MNFRKPLNALLRIMREDSTTKKVRLTRYSHGGG